MFGALIQKQVARIDSEDKVDTPDSTSKLTSGKSIQKDTSKKPTEKTVQWKRNSIAATDPQNAKGTGVEEIGKDKTLFSKEPAMKQMNETSPREEKNDESARLPLGDDEHDEIDGGEHSARQLEEMLKKVESLMECGQNAEALKDLQHLEEHFTKSDQRIYLKMSECERRLNQFIKAIEFLENAIDLDPTLPCSKTSKEEYARNKNILKYSNDI